MCGGDHLRHRDERNQSRNAEVYFNDDNATTVNCISQQVNHTSNETENPAEDIPQGYFFCGQFDLRGLRHTMWIGPVNRE